MPLRSRHVRCRCGRPDQSVVLTFDDGYADLHEHALPLLVDHGFPATVFVTTGWLHDAGRWSAGRPLDSMLTWAQLRELRDAGIEIGAHSHSHAQLDQLGNRSLQAELDLGKVLLEDALRTPIHSLAYPFGYSSRRVRRAAEEAGYLQAAGVANNSARPAVDDAFEVPRLTVRRSTSPATFGGIAACEGLNQIFALDRLLTTGWAAVRRSRSALRAVRRG
jgi:peptidoglycan/xylan/chitin deacetylase (PgdA/CDA1 family)